MPRPETRVRRKLIECANWPTTTQTAPSCERKGLFICVEILCLFTDAYLIVYRFAHKARGIFGFTPHAIWLQIVLFNVILGYVSYNLLDLFLNLSVRKYCYTWQ